MKKWLPILLVVALLCGTVAAGAESARVFGIAYPIIHPFFEGTTQGAQDAAAELGIELIVKGPDRADVQQQIEIVENMIAMKVDGIAIGPTDSMALKPLIDKAMEQGIQVVTFDTDSADSARLGYIGTDNVSAGRHMGEVLGTLLDGKGNVLVSMGVPTQQNLKERLDGVKAVLAEKYPEIQIIDEQSGQGDPSKTLANIEDMVNAHPEFDALIGIDAAAGPAVVTAWKAKGLTQPVIVFDDTDDILKGVRDGQITVTLAQSQYLWGETIVKELNDACDGKEVPAFFDAGTREVNKDNIDELYPQ